MNWIKIDPKDPATWPVCEEGRCVLAKIADSRCRLPAYVMETWEAQDQRELLNGGSTSEWSHWCPITPPKD